MGIEIYTDEELENEMEKRRKEKLGPWPKYYTFDAELVIDGNALDSFLCDTAGGDEEFSDQAYESLDIFPKITIAVDENGTVSIVEFNGTKLESNEEEDSEETVSC